METELALVVVDDNKRHQEIVAGGRYIVDPPSRLAELAFTVRDDWQGCGIGGVLSELVCGFFVSFGRDIEGGTHAGS